MGGSQRRWLSLALAATIMACSEYGVNGKPDDPPGSSGDSGPAGTPGTPPEACAPEAFPPDSVVLAAGCEGYTFGGTPVVEWEIPREGRYDAMSLPAVADLDGDGVPEIVVNWADHSLGRLAVYGGDGSGKRWEVNDADLACCSGPVVADLNADGVPEILTVRDDLVQVDGVASSFSIVAWSPDGGELWQSASFDTDAFDFMTAIAVSDMDHDGSPEIVAGRAILNADGSTRGEGRYGNGALFQGFSGGPEGPASAVADLDLDGTEEVVVGNARYGPDGDTLWYSDTLSDGAVAIANLDEDPQGEWIVVRNNEIRAQDTDGTVIWGPLAGESGREFGPPAIADIDGDGRPEVVAPCGSELWALNGEDGSLLWTVPIQDVSGAVGASLFDFDADGFIEVVYADEVAIYVLDGQDGRVQFTSDDHLSDTAMEYPVVADLDGDGAAEILVAHIWYDAGLTIYGASEGGNWAPARPLWNQHAYSITNINDDLSVPTAATQNFTVYNNWHSAQATLPGGRLGGDLQAEILQVCKEDCGDGLLWVTARGRNAGSDPIPAGLSVALYAVRDGERVFLDSTSTTADTPAATTTESLTFQVVAADLQDADSIFVSIDDDGNGVGQHWECEEDNNQDQVEGPWCP